MPWIYEMYGFDEKQYIEWNIYEGNYSCNALGQKAFVDTPFSCFIFQLPFFLESINFGYITLAVVLPILIISIFGKIKQSYRWFIFNQAFWDFFIAYSFLCNKPTWEEWFKDTFYKGWFKMFRPDYPEWFYQVNQAPPTCFYSIDDPHDYNPLKHILSSILYYAAKDACYAPLLLLAFSRFVILYYNVFWHRFFTTAKVLFLIIFFNFFCILIVNLDELYIVIRRLFIVNELAQCNEACGSPNGTDYNGCTNNCTLFYYRILYIPHFKIIQLSLPLIILTVSHIFGVLLIRKIVRQFRFQAKHNKASLFYSIKIATLIFLQCFTMTFLFSISSVKNFYKVMESINNYDFNNAKIVNYIPAWLRFLSLDVTISCFNMLRIFIDSVLILTLLPDYCHAVKKFAIFCGTVIRRPKALRGKVASKENTKIRHTNSSKNGILRDKTKSMITVVA